MIKNIVLEVGISPHCHVKKKNIEEIKSIWILYIWIIVKLSKLLNKV